MVPVLPRRYYCGHKHSLSLRKKPSRDERLLEGRILAYDLELQRYRLSNPFKKRVVLVGPSYVSRLGSFEQIHNLGFTGATPSEIERIIERYCREGDFVFYGFTLFDLFEREEGGETLPFSSFHRKKLVIKALFSHKHGKPAKGLFEKQSGKIRNLRDKDIRVGARRLAELCRRHPHMRIVMFPIYPQREIVEKTNAMKRLLTRANVPLIDLTGVLDKNQFTDCFHHTPDGVNLLRARIAARMGRETLPQIARGL